MLTSAPLFFFAAIFYSSKVFQFIIIRLSLSNDGRVLYKNANFFTPYLKAGTLFVQKKGGFVTFTLGREI